MVPKNCGNMKSKLVDNGFNADVVELEAQDAISHMLDILEGVVLADNFGFRISEDKDFR